MFLKQALKVESSICSEFRRPTRTSSDRGMTCSDRHYSPLRSKLFAMVFDQPRAAI